MLDIGSFINKMISIVTTPSEIAQQKISKQKEYCEQLIQSCLIAEQNIESLFSVSKYIDICEIAQWQNENTNLYKSVNECNNGVLNRIILSRFDKGV